VLSFPLILFSKIVGLVLTQVQRIIIRKGMKLFLISPRNHKKLSNEISILLSSQRVGFMNLTRNNGVSFVSLSILPDLYRNIENNLPFGRLNEIVDFKEGMPFELSIKKS